MATQQLSTKDDVDIRLMQQDISYIRADIAEMKKALQNNYVTKDQFLPVKRIAYGAITFISAVFVTVLGYLASGRTNVK